MGMDLPCDWLGKAQRGSKTYNLPTQTYQQPCRGYQTTKELDMIMDFCQDSQLHLLGQTTAITTGRPN